MTRKDAWQIGKLILSGNKGIFAGAIGIIIGMMMATMFITGVFITVPVTLFWSVENEIAMSIVTAILWLARTFMVSLMTLGFTGLCYRLYCGQQCRASVVLYYLAQPKIILKKIGLDLVLCVVPFAILMIILIIDDPPLNFVIFLLIVLLGLIFPLYSIYLAGNIFLIVYPDLPFFDMIKVSFQVGLRNTVTQFIMTLQVVGIQLLVTMITSMVFDGIGTSIILVLPIVLMLYLGGILLNIWLQVSLTVYYTAHIAQSGYIPDGRIQA